MEFSRIRNRIFGIFSGTVLIRLEFFEFLKWYFWNKIGIFGNKFKLNEIESFSLEFVECNCGNRIVGTGF